MNRAFDKVTDVQLKACIEGVIYGEYGNMEWYRLAVQLGQPKVQFDTENIDIAPIAGLPPAAALVDFLGVHTLSNGLTFWGMQAGGDWEIPVCFIIYLSDGRFRIYIPKLGTCGTPSARRLTVTRTTTRGMRTSDSTVSWK